MQVRICKCENALNTLTHLLIRILKCTSTTCSISRRKSTITFSRYKTINTYHSYQSRERYARAYTRQTGSHVEAWRRLPSHTHINHRRERKPNTSRHRQNYYFNRSRYRFPIRRRQAMETSRHRYYRFLQLRIR